MRFRVLLILTFLSFFFFGSCFTSRKLEHDQNDLKTSFKETQYYNVFTNATKHALFGNNNTAIPLYEACIEEFPERAAPYFQLSSIYLRENDSEKALFNARKAVELDPSNKWYKEHLASIYQFLGKYPEAVSIYSDLLEDYPDDELRYNLSLLHLEQGHYPEAIEVINKLDDQYLSSYEVLMLRHNAYHQMGNYDSAIIELERVVGLFSDGIDSYGILAEYLAEVGRLDYAKDVYMFILEQEPENGLALLSYSEFFLNQNMPDSAFVYLGRACCCSDLELNDKLNTIINLMVDPDFTTKHENDIALLIEYLGDEHKDFSYYAAKADLLMNLQKFDDVKPVLDSVLLYEKENYLVWEQTLRVNSQLGMYDEVIRIAEEAIIYFPDEINIYLLRAGSYLSLERYQDAIDDLSIILKQELDNFQKIQIYNMMAEAYRSSGMHAESDLFFEKILAIDLSNKIIRNNYAYYLSLREEKLEYALELSKYTIDKEPLNPTYLDTYGWILFKLGRIEEAKGYVEAAIRNGSNENPEVLEHYGDIMVALDRCSDAIEAYEIILEISKSEVVQSKLDILKQECL